MHWSFSFNKPNNDVKELRGRPSLPRDEGRCGRLSRGCAVVVFVLLGLLTVVGGPSAIAQDCVDYSDYLRWVGGMHGDFRAIAITDGGDYACIGGSFGDHFRMVDISDPIDPEIIGGLTLPQTVNDVTVVGNYAYVANHDYGLSVIGITDPRNPLRVGYVVTSGRARAVAVDGQYAYLAASGLHVINISDPTNPFVVGSLNTAQATGVAVGSEYVYLALQDPGRLHEVDVSDPGNPIIRRTLPMPGRTENVTVEGNYAYVPTFSGLQIIELSTFSIVGSASAGVGDVAIAGNLAFTVGRTLRVVDVSDPENPTVIGGSGVDYAGGVAIFGDYVYCTAWGGCTWGLNVFDASNSTSPGVVDIVPGGGNRGIAGAGTHVYAGEGGYGYPSRFHVIDATTPQSPSIVGSVAAPGWPNDIALDGNYAYLAATHPPAFISVDISDPGSPTIVGNAATSYDALGVAVAAGYAYVAVEADAAGLCVVDISTPEDPRIIRTVPTSRAYDVAVANEYVYVAARYEFLVVDISVPSEAAIVAIVDMGTASAYGVAVAGPHAYVACGQAGLRVIDISEPRFPVIVGECYAATAVDVAVSGRTAYVASEYAGLSVIDVSNPAAPRFLGSTESPTAACTYGVVVVDGYVYVTTAGYESNDVVVLPTHCDETTAVPAATAPAVAGLTLLTAEPNPAVHSVRLAFDLPYRTEAELRIYDVTGRCVRRLLNGAVPAGPSNAIWDRRDDRGGIVAAGVYVARLTWPGGSISRRVVMIR